MPWYKYTTAQYASQSGSDVLRIVPVYGKNLVHPYTWNNYVTACNDEGLRAFVDNGCNSDSAMWCSGYGSSHTSCNAGGHDVMNNMIKVLQQTTESGHCGYPLITQEQFAKDLLSLGVPPGKHNLGIKHAHDLGSKDTPAWIEFTLADNPNGVISSFSSSYSTSSTTLDIALCAPPILEYMYPMPHARKYPPPSPHPVPHPSLSPQWGFCTSNHACFSPKPPPSP